MIAGMPISLLDRALVPRERRLLAQARPSPHPVLLIVGAPRSGTTLVHQLLTSHLVASYFTNRNSLFNRAPLAASQIWDTFPGGGPSRRSFYGLSRGLRGPNDAFHIWNRWAGVDRYTPGALSPEMMEDMRRFFDAWRTVHPMALVNKNNRNTAQMAELAKAIEGVRFVVVHRDPVYVVQSLMEAREMVQGSAEIGWGLASRSNGDPVDDVIQQVREIRAMVERDAPPGAIHIDYEHLCEDPTTVVTSIAADTTIPLRNVADIRPLRPANVDRLDGRTLERIRVELS